MKRFSYSPLYIYKIYQGWTQSPSVLGVLNVPFGSMHIQTMINDICYVFFQKITQCVYALSRKGRRGPPTKRSFESPLYLYIYRRKQAKEDRRRSLFLAAAVCSSRQFTQELVCEGFIVLWNKKKVQFGVQREIDFG